MKDAKLYDKVKRFIVANEGREITSLSIIRNVPEVECRYKAADLLGRVYRTTSFIYRVWCGTYIFDRKAKHEEYTNNIDRLISYAKERDSVTKDDIIEQCLVTPEGAQALLTKLNKRSNVVVEKKVHYVIKEVELVD